MRPLAAVIPSADGGNRSFFGSELTWSHRGPLAASLNLACTTPVRGGSGVAFDVILRPGRQRIIPGAIDYLGSRNAPNIFLQSAGDMLISRRYRGKDEPGGSGPPRTA